MQDQIMPSGLLSVLGSETRDFAVKAGRAQPLKASLFILFFGIAWLLFSSIFVVAFLGPLFVGKEVHFLADDVPTVAGPGNLGPIIVPAMIIGVFVLVGIGMISWGVVLLTKKGGWFAGTPTRLVSYQGGTIRSIDWEQFSGDIEISGNDQKGNLTLQLRSGRMVSQKNGLDHYVPDTVYISAIPDVYKVERLCRMRIRENDSTPVEAHETAPPEIPVEPQKSPFSGDTEGMKVF
jgi:hypothetical protein